ncbi:MAG: hypothetical protein NVS3B5_04760 [Sphingomicrobium sp.]
MNGKRNHYVVLGVGENAKPADIRAAYRSLMRQYHPDLNPTEHAAVQARLVNEAYRVLRDPNLRAGYNEHGNRVALVRGHRSPIWVPPGGGRAVRRHKEIVDYGEAGVGRSWIPFVMFILLSAGSVTAAVESGLFEPKIASAQHLDVTRTDPANGKHIDGLIARPADMYAASSPLMMDDAIIDNAPAPLLTDIAEGAGEFARVSGKGGITGAERYSLECHRALKILPSWRAADRCTAFDFAAGYVDEDVASTTRSQRDKYFLSQQGNAEENYQVLRAPPFSAAARLAEIRKVLRPSDVAGDEGSYGR